ncbi:chemotaxis protein CheY [Cohnella kolymensis]|uniref:Transcriptional regulatory protein n=1 Tax=Cohnella kolymensis TaxID=1590652 RepID=A0ABR5A4U4_9BACL|nr:response regulator [Cohnella kolymensis]KIL35947.1 chemotaxis protein CheY [Cohnella kolymensis]
MIQVLIVEDNIRNAEINKRFVEKVEGYQAAGIATDGRQAKDLLEILTPDLVLLDLYLPDVHGFDLLRHIKLNHTRTDIIMVTAAKELHTVREAIHGGVFDYILKPVIYERLEETLQKYKSFRSKISALEEQGSESTVDQYKIDQLLRLNEGDKSRSSYPKGIDQLTLDKVTAYTNRAETSFTAEQVGADLGISRSTSRRYLEFLVSSGKVAADLAYGSVGRPERVYRKK